MRPWSRPSFKPWAGTAWRAATLTMPPTTAALTPQPTCDTDTYGSANSVTNATATWLSHVFRYGCIARVTRAMATTAPDRNGTNTTAAAAAAAAHSDRGIPACSVPLLGRSQVEAPKQHRPRMRISPLILLQLFIRSHTASASAIFCSTYTLTNDNAVPGHSDGLAHLSAQSENAGADCACVWMQAWMYAWMKTWTQGHRDDWTQKHTQLNASAPPLSDDRKPPMLAAWWPKRTSWP